MTGPGQYPLLRDLAVRYAQAVDRRDSGALLELFTPDAVVTVVPPPESTRAETRMVGHDGIGGIIGTLTPFRRTFHFLGQSCYEAGERTRGEVYCIAHHLEEASNYVMYIRYDDEYTRTDPGTWLIADRRVVIDWTERRSLR